MLRNVLTVSWVEAEQAAQRMQDEFISVEHLFLAIMDEHGSTGAGRVNKSFGLTKDKVLEAMTHNSRKPEGYH